MADPVNLRVGPQTGADGSILAQRGGKYGEEVVQQAHGKYYEPTSRGSVYSAQTCNARCAFCVEELRPASRGGWRRCWRIPW